MMLTRLQAVCETCEASLRCSPLTCSLSIPHDPLEGVAKPLSGWQREGVYVGLGAFAVHPTGCSPAWYLYERCEAEEDPVTGLSRAGVGVMGASVMVRHPSCSDTLCGGNTSNCKYLHGIGIR